MRASMFGTAAVLVASLATGCSSKSNGSSTTAHIRSYFTAIASNSAVASRAGLTHAAPDSPAYRYLQYFAFAADANDDGGRPGVAAEVGEVTTKEVKLCDGPQCGTFSDIAVDSSGRVSDFAIEGVPFNSRLVIGGGRHVAAGGGTVTLLASYQAGTPGNEHVVVKVVAGDRPLKVIPDKATFQDSNDLETDPIFSVGRMSLTPNESGTILWSFPIRAARGSIRIAGCSGSPCIPWTATVTI